jgi:amidohydrolase
MSRREELKATAVQAIERRKDDLIAVSKELLHSPEPGFFEWKASQRVSAFFAELGVPHQESIAITGVRGELHGGSFGPTVTVLGELDALLVPTHPLADPKTGAAHACGHHAQIGMLLGTIVGLLARDVMPHLAGRVMPFAVPAEELVQLTERLELRRQGKLEFLGGKQELIRLGALDGVDIAMMCHTTTGNAPTPFVVGGTSNDNMIKLVRYRGLSAHAGRSPYLGVNALNAATFAINAIHFNRETFLDDDVARSHGIITKGGDSPNAVPANVQLEWRVRAGSSDALDRYSAIADRCFKAGALAVGAKVSIQNIPGYLPMRNDPSLQRLFIENAEALLGKGSVTVVPADRNPGGSTDMGDVSHVIPSIHPYVGGTVGSNHSKDYLVTDWETAVVAPAKAIACTVIDLLSDGAAKAREVLARAKPAMTRDEYLAMQRRRASLIEFDGATATG